MAIHQEIRIKGTLEAIFRALTTETEFSKFTGYPAEIEDGEGGAFTCFNGQITGRTVEKIENKKLIQDWRVEAWAEGIF
jgi:activator of HSP90 ATPase